MPQDGNTEVNKIIKKLLTVIHYLLTPNSSPLPARLILKDALELLELYEERLKKS